ncbi:hypothetical protein ACLB2K_030562 [Fragaria x ananassa]
MRVLSAPPKPNLLPPLSLSLSAFEFLSGDLPATGDFDFRKRFHIRSDRGAVHDKSLDLSFEEDGRRGTFVIGNDRFPASLLDLPTVVESYKTYDDSVLIKTADIGQMIMVRDPNDRVQAWSHPSYEGCSEEKIPQGAGSKHII